MLHTVSGDLHRQKISWSINAWIYILASKAKTHKYTFKNSVKKSKSLTSLVKCCIFYFYKLSEYKLTCVAGWL